MSRIERGVSNPSVDALEILADALGVPVSVLLSNCDSVTPRGVFVPFAKDGSFFSPELKRPQTGEFCVGSKESPVYTSNYWEALEILVFAEKAQWLRPNKNGKWGVVTASYWSSFPISLNCLSNP
jgi:transcriptional regulator with XRE-family HTH domain